MLLPEVFNYIKLAEEIFIVLVYLNNLVNICQSLLDLIGDLPILIINPCGVDLFNDNAKYFH